MDWLLGGLTDWIKQSLIDAIMASFGGIFDGVNEQVGDIAVQVGQTPQSWNAAVFDMVRTLSETVVIPIAGMILTFVMCYELITLIIEKNKMADFDTFNIFKWFFKTFIAVIILTNTFNLVMGVFDVGQHVVNASAGLITGSLELGDAAMMATIEASLQAMGIGELIGLFLETQIVRLCLSIMSIVIFIIIWGRMIEIYLTISIAPIPLSTMTNREWGSMGNNYLKSLFALAFQGFLIMVCVAIYSALVANIADADNMHAAIWTVAGYTALLIFILMRTSNLSKSIFQAS
jgi:hypothetical protein